MARRWFLLLFVFYLFCLYTTLDQASFYGGSFISVPFKEAKSSTDIRFKFRTHLSNGVILLVAGTTDYCIVSLDNGRLKVNINLGAGESELLSSSKAAKLNDFKWHDVCIARKEANLSVVIDNFHTVQKQLPGKFFELNIHYGLFLGGHGNYSEIFFGHLDKFRGCLSDVMYNGMLVLEQARRRQSQVIVQGVTWNCASEFDTNTERPISFVEDGAFMTIPHIVQHNQLKVHFEMKTVLTDSILIYNSGHSLKPDFFTVELFKERIKCTLKHGDRAAQIISDNLVSDGKWHKITIHATPTIVDLRVDSIVKSLKNSRAHFPELNDVFFIGGLEISKRARAMSKGLKVSDVSFKGCIHHLSIGEQQKGLPDVQVSEGLLPGCVWQYPCLREPCSPKAVCIQHGLDSFQCRCEEELCVSSNYTEGYKIFSHGNLATELEILAVEPLQVLEGQSAVITPNNLHMILDYVKYGIKDSGVNFTIAEQPAHGSISINVWPHEKNSFTLYDVSHDKVHYVHDGSENHHDHLVLEVEFTAGDSFLLPSYLQGKFKFTLVANVVPINDPPIINIPITSVLRLAQGSKKIVDSTFIATIDPDSSPNEIVITVIETPSGHFENVDKPSVPISSFTQSDVNNGRVLFVHHSKSSNESFVSLQVSDGIKTSGVSKLRISTFPQHWRLQNNTGLVLMHSTSAVITPYNLSFTSNVPGADDNGQFHIIKGPQFGVVEVERLVGKWENAIVFTNDDLRQHRVRYRHVISTPEFDEFQFRNSLNTSVLYTFRMSFKKCSLLTVTTNTLYLNSTWENVLTAENLNYQTEPIKSSKTSIVYKITEPPKYGYLFSPVSKYRLRIGDSFTQEDVVSKNIKYRLHRKTYSYVRDSFLFSISAPGCKNLTGNVTIVHHPSKETSSKVRVIVERLRVDEGAKACITPTHLDIRSDVVDDLVFNVTKSPSHGILQVDKNNIARNETYFFTLNELYSNQLFYVHDGSETRRDYFEFLAFSKDDEIFQYIEKFHIDIVLKNDNSPVRSVDKIFHVVVGGQRLLTGNDLRYTDEDLNTLPSDIVYTCRELTNGDMYSALNDSIKITEFTQEDLNNNLVLFKHKGPEYGKVKLWVTDGQFYVNGVLEIQASAPFIRVFTNKKLIVQHKKSSVITEDHLSYTTNVYAFDKDVVYEIIDKANFGKIVSTQNYNELTEFTHEQIKARYVSYIHEVDTARADEVNFKVRCRNVVNTAAQLGIWMLPAGYWDPIAVKTLKPLTVEESTSAVINKNTLEVTQREVPADSLLYYTMKPPENGYLSVLSNVENANEYTNVNSLTQSQINENRVFYIQLAANQTKDEIVFNVTNGIVWLENVVLDIIIIPERLYVGSNNLSVNEGGKTVLTLAHLYVITDYYKTRVTDYVILQEPQYGCMQVFKKCTKLHGFTHKELVSGFVQYSHDGSENLQDEITLVAVAGQKRSIPVILMVNVLPVNDQSPVLINNTGLTMWEGGKAIITNTMLAAVDADRPKDTLRYQVLGCWWGNVSVLSDPYTSLQFFTQELIDNNLIVFQHQNGSEAKFDFNVTDGLHSTKKHTFHIRAKPVSLKLYSKPLHIFPLQRKFLTSSNLLTVASDDERAVYYEIVTPPTMGRLMMESHTSGIFSVVHSFTQEDLNNSKVFYEHTHPFADLYMNDSFIFSVKAHLAPTLFHQKLKIDISVSSGGLDVYVNIPKITVDEGGSTNIPLNLTGVVTFLENHAGLRSPVIHSSAGVPQHGQIFLQNSPNLSTFTQQQLESGQVCYQHDHSDSTGDNIYFSLYLIPGYILLCNITVPIVVNPINDQPFKLITRAPHLTVVQGENHTITRSELLTEDADTSPADLSYDIINGPSDGQLVLLPDAIPISHFSQADVDENKLVYIHNGSLLTDTFHLRVWDGEFRPEYTVFNVKVLPVTMNVSAVLPVYLQQGSNVVLLSNKQFFIETNANKRRVYYVLKTEPKRGTLYVNDAPSNSFNQTDLDNQCVMYMQTDMTTANDSFQVFVGLLTGDVSIGNKVDVTIKVQPLMQIGNFTAITGESNKVTLHVLDATPLAKLTNSNPIYTITRFPIYGHVRKIIRSSGEKRNILDVPVTNFTHEEVQSGLIYFVVKDIELGWNGLQDHIEFILAASIFQPAVGTLRISLKSSLHNDIFSTLAGPNDPAGHEGGMQVASPNMTRDYFLIVSMVAGVVILGVAVIIIIKCRSFDTEELNKEEQCMQPIPLPRPPDRLMVSSPSLKQHIQDGFASPIPATLPHCKVTPLNKNDLESHACYPYGVDEHPDDWSSCEASDPACQNRNIMLRRNQYWV